MTKPERDGLADGVNLHPLHDTFDVGGLQGRMFVRVERWSIGVMLAGASTSIGTISADEVHPGRW